MSDAAVSLKKLARNRRFDELEGALLEAISSGEIGREDLVAILNLAAHRGEVAELDTLFWLALGAYTERHGPAEGLAAVREAAPLLPGAKTIREDLIALVPTVNAEHPGAGPFARRLFGELALPLPEAFKRLDHLLALSPGTPVLVKGAKTPSRVVGASEAGDKVLLDGPGGPSEVDLDAALRLSPLDPNDYRAVAALDAERFAAWAVENPAGLVEDVLRRNGPRLAYRELRGLLVDLLPVPFAQWWNEARPRLRRSPWIDMTASNQPTLELRRTPLAHDQEIRDAIDQADSPLERIGVIVDHLDESGEHVAAEADLLRHFADVLAATAAAGEGAVAVAAHAILAEIAEIAPAAVEGLALPEPPFDRSPSELLASLGHARFEIPVLELARTARPDAWPEFYGKALPVLTAEGAEFAADELTEAGREDVVFGAAREIMAAPRRHLGALVWLWKHAASGRLPEAEGGPNRGDLMAHLLGTMDREGRGDRARGPLYSVFQTALTAQNFGLARRALEETDLGGARRLLETIDRSLGIGQALRTKLQDLLAESHPKVFAKDVPAWAREDVVYTTAAGLAKKNEEYARMVHETLPAIADAIGRAAAHGDLSENAEYTAALEERERMTERANALKRDLDMAKEIPPEFADSEVVTVGSRVRAKNVATEEETVFTFLGPWDVDLANGVYSYRAPLSQVFMGKRVGDVVEVQRDRFTERYEILEKTFVVA